MLMTGLQVAEILHYLLVEDETSTHLAEFQSRVRQNTPQAEKELRRYVLEIQRITTYKRSLRVVTTACTVDDVSFKPGDYAMVDFVSTQSGFLSFLTLNLVLIILFFYLGHGWKRSRGFPRTGKDQAGPPTSEIYRIRPRSARVLLPRNRSELHYLHLEAGGCSSKCPSRSWRYGCS